VEEIAAIFSASGGKDSLIEPSQEEMIP